MDENKQKLLMIMFNNDVIKLHNYNTYYELKDEYAVNKLLEFHGYKSKHIQDSELAIENVKSISIITVEKAIKLELKLDFDTKIIEKLPLII